MRRKVQEFVQLALDGGHVFHGSPESFSALEPHQTRRGSKGTVVYDAISAHATPILCCALNYIGRSGDNNTYVNGVSLRDVPVREILVVGPKTLKDAMNYLFGRGGFLYAFDSSDFEHVEGLGRSEVRSLTPVVPTHKLRLSYEDVRELAKFCGVKFVFCPNNKNNC
jgi:hypothetical protein